MDVKQAAQQLGVSTGTVRNWIRTGRLSAVSRVENARVKYHITDRDVLNLMPDGSSGLTRDEAVADSLQTNLYAPIRIGISMDPEPETPAPGRVTEHVSLVQVSDTMHRHIHHQYTLYESIQAEFNTLQSEVAQAQANLAETRDLVRQVHEVVQRGRDAHVIQTLQTSPDRGRHRKHKSSWW